MVTLLKRGVALLAIPAALAIAGSTSLAAGSSAPTLFGGATYNSQGVQLVSNATTPFSGIELPVPSGTTLNNIQSLDANYQMLQGDCALGSPRYSITLGTGKNIFAYFGDAPAYHCGSAPRYQPNLLVPFVDDSQVPGGTFYDTYAHAQAIAGTQPVTHLFVVLDGGTSAAPQVTEIHSLSVNGMVYNFAPPTSVDQCKHGGYKNFTNPHPFKNQGQCIKFVKGGDNGDNGGDNGDNGDNGGGGNGGGD